MESLLEVRQATVDDTEKVCEIYNWYIANTIITFELEPITPTEMQERILEKLQKFEWLVAELNGEIVGYAYAGVFRARAAYDHTIESSIYLAHNITGKGFGRVLYQALIDRCRDLGFKEMIGGAALPNDASIKIHEQLGFEKIGVFPRVGFKFGNFIDVGFWQLRL